MKEERKKKFFFLVRKLKSDKDSCPPLPACAEISRWGAFFLFEFQIKLHFAEISK